jgi:hypothetical protein
MAGHRDRHGPVLVAPLIAPSPHLVQQVGARPDEEAGDDGAGARRYLELVGEAGPEDPADQRRNDRAQAKPDRRARARGVGPDAAPVSARYFLSE